MLYYAGALSRVLEKMSAKWSRAIEKGRNAVRTLEMLRPHQNSDDVTKLSSLFWLLIILLLTVMKNWIPLLEQR